MPGQFRIAIVGAGPAGLSAAARARHYDAPAGGGHVLLEGSAAIARTIQRYQKGKHVMAEPGYLDLRSPLPFAAGTREQVLAAWQQGAAALGINLRHDAEVRRITGARGDFTVELQSGDSINAEYVVLAVGVQGNPRRLGVAGDDESDFVRYTLDDPAQFAGETIVVVGAGDAAIENAIALSARNTVHIVNRRDEFSRAKDGNLAAVLAAINDSTRDFHCSYNSGVAALELPAAGAMGAIVLDTPAGRRRIPCHRVIARLGAVPPRQLLEDCGIAPAGSAADALPVLDRRYQSTVPGLYVIGALAGCPLIKQAMNQGHDVVEFIHGQDIKPADYPLLQRQFAHLPYVMDAEDVLDLYQHRVPMFRRMNPLAFRELMIESTVITTMPAVAHGAATGEPATRGARRVPAGAALYRDGDYSNTFYTIVEGEVRLQLEAGGPWFTLGAGQFFGEMSLISGRPRQGEAVAGADCILVETPRRIMVKLMNSSEDVRRGIDRVFVARALQAAFRPALSFAELMQLADEVELCRFSRGEPLYQQGEAGDCLHLVRSGTVVLSTLAGRAALAHRQSGQLVGQMALMGDPVRHESATAAVRVETICIRRPQFLRLVGSRPDQVAVLQRDASELLLRCADMAARPEAAESVGFLMAQGLGEATNALVIREDLCVGCDNCERACAETHGGIARLDRSAGPAWRRLHVAVSCRHCELPHCMKDCPTDAIRRAPAGEVFIADSCIGCGNCVTNCPYGAIRLSYAAPPKPGLWRWLLFGAGPGPGEQPGFEATAAAREHGKKAVKCDACMGQPGGPACVRACPTGAAVRLSPAGFAELVAGG